MKMSALCCPNPKCKESGQICVVINGPLEKGPTDRQMLDVRLDVELACERCGSGWTVIDTWTSPLSWIRDFFDFVPKGGSPVRVTPSPENGEPIGFDYKDKHYEVVETLLSLRLPQQDPSAIRDTYYLVQLDGGDALLKQQAVSIGSGPQAAWFLVDEDLEQARRWPDALPRPPFPNAAVKARNAMSCYFLLYRAETFLRRAIERAFSINLPEVLKTVTVGHGDKQQPLLQKLSDLKDQEMAGSLRCEEFPLLDYAELTDLIQLVAQKWEVLFPGKQRAKERFTQKLEDLRGVRIKVAHMRGGSYEDLRLLQQTYEELRSSFPDTPTW